MRKGVRATITPLSYRPSKRSLRPSFFALLVIAVSFLPVFTLEAQEGRLFKPLAYTKTFAMAIAAVLAITLDPAMRLLFTHMDDFKIKPRWVGKIVNAVLVGKIHSEDNHPISRPLMKIYHPVVEFVLEHQVEDDCRRCSRNGIDDSCVL